MNTGVPQGINPSEHLNLTGNPRGPGSLEKTVMDQLGRVSGRLKAERAANSHLKVLGSMMAGVSPFGRLDVTAAGSAQYKVGKHVLDIPTANAMAHTVDLRGVKYAPMTTAVWEGGSYRMLTASQALESQLLTLGPAIKDHSVRQQIREMREVVKDVRDRNLMHVRFNAKASGGALPWALSHQVAFVTTGPMGTSLDAGPGPLAMRSIEMESSLSEAIGGVTGKMRGAVGKGAYRFKGGLSYQKSREALVRELAFIMEGLSQPGVESVGVKTVRMTGYNPLGTSKRLQEGQAGRVIFSRLPTNATGLHFPGGASAETGPYGQLPKSIHHMRARMFLPTDRLLELRDHQAHGIDTTGWSGEQIARLTYQRQYKLGMGTRRNVMPVLRNSWEAEARIAAGEHYALQGAVARGTKVGGVLSTPVKVLGIGIRGNLTREEARVAGKVMGTLFADSGAYITSNYASGVLNMHRQIRELRNLPKGMLTAGAGQMGGRAVQVHPTIAPLLKNQGMQGTISFGEGLTRADLPAVGGHEAGYVGTALNGEGEVMMTRGREVTLHLGRRDRLMGFQATPGGLRPLIHRPVRTGEKGVSFLLEGKRLGAMGGLNSHADIVAAMDWGGTYQGAAPGHKIEHGLGLDIGERNLRMTTELEYLRQEAGEEGLQRLSRNFPQLLVKTERARRGGRLHTEHVLHYNKKSGQISFDDLMSAVKKTRKEMGLSESGIVGGSLGQLGGQFMAMLGPAGRKMLREHGIDSLNKILETRSMFAEMANRSGQPERGLVGTVKYTLRDLNMYSVQTAAMGGEDVESMFRNLPRAIRRAGDSRGLNLSDAEIRRAAWAAKRYRGMALGSTLDVATPDRAFLEAQLAIAEGRVPAAGARTKHYNVITWKDFQEKFTNVLGEYESGGTLEQFRGSHLVEEVNGRLRPTSKATIIDMGVQGLMPLERKLQGQAVETRFLSLPGGRSVGLQAGEPAYLVKGAGDIPGLGHDTVQAVQALHGEDAALAFQAAGRAQLSGLEKMFAKGHKAFGKRLKQSFSGTLVSNSALEVGEVGLSQSNVEKMLRSAGFRGHEVKGKIRRIIEGTEDFFVTLKTEPMRGAQESTVAKVRLTAQERGRNKVLSTASRLIEGQSQAIEVSQWWLPGRFRDVDHDPGYVYNLAEGTGKKLRTDHIAEQQYKAFQHRYMQAEYEATQHFAQMRMADKIVKSSTKRSLTADMYSGLMDEAMKLLSPQAQGRMTGDIFGKSLAATMAAGPELLTPVANLRWRRTRQMLENVASGSGLDDLMAKKGVSAAQRQTAEEAIAYAKSNTKALKWLMRLSEESEYTVLKKEKVLGMLMGDADAVKAADPRLMALSFADELLNPQGKGYNQAVGKLAGRVRALARESDSDWLGAFARTESIGKRSASERIAKMIGAGRQIEAAAQESQMEFLQRAASAAARGETRMPDGGALPLAARLVGRDPEFANRAMGGYVGPMAETARTAAQGIPGPGPSVKDATIGAVGEAMELAKQLWGSKYGKPIMIGGAAIMGLGVIQTMTGGGGAGAHGSSPMGGAPLPPPPMVQANAMDRGEFIMPKTDFAYMDRPSQIRTQMHFSVGTNGRSADYTDFADTEMGALGRAPMHSGLMYDTTSPMMLRHQVDATIRQRMRSSF